MRVFPIRRTVADPETALGLYSPQSVAPGDRAMRLGREFAALDKAVTGPWAIGLTLGLQQGRGRIRSLGRGQARTGKGRGDQSGGWGKVSKVCRFDHRDDIEGLSKGLAPGFGPVGKRAGCHGLLGGSPHRAAPWHPRTRGRRGPIWRLFRAPRCRWRS